MALRSGIAPSELIAYPLVYDALVEDLQDIDEDNAVASRRAQTRAMLKSAR